jgi:hypothetical protein
VKYLSILIIGFPSPRALGRGTTSRGMAFNSYHWILDFIEKELQPPSKTLSILIIGFRDTTASAISLWMQILSILIIGFRQCGIV